MSEITITLDGLEAMFALDALAEAAGKAEHEADELRQQGAPTFLLAIAEDTARLRERAHVKVRDALYPPDDFPESAVPWPSEDFIQ